MRHAPCHARTYFPGRPQGSGKGRMDTLSCKSTQYLTAVDGIAAKFARTRGNEAPIVSTHRVNTICKCNTSPGVYRCSLTADAGEFAVVLDATPSYQREVVPAQPSSGRKKLDAVLAQVAPRRCLPAYNAFYPKHRRGSKRPRSDVPVPVHFVKYFVYKMDVTPIDCYFRGGAQTYEVKKTRRPRGVCVCVWGATLERLRFVCQSSIRRTPALASSI